MQTIDFEAKYTSLNESLLHFQHFSVLISWKSENILWHFEGN